jgi:hypothetical protein
VKFAKYWDLIANSGRFKKTLPLILSLNASRRSAFWSFFELSEFLWLKTEKTHALTPEQLVDLMFEFLTNVKGMEIESVRKTLLQDYVASGARLRPRCLAMEKIPLSGERDVAKNSKKAMNLATRQHRHL